MIHELSSETQFRNIINMYDYVLVDFFAEWCGPCMKIAPWLKEFSNQHPEVGFVKADVEILDDLAQHYKVRAMPTFVLLKKGVEIKRLVGANEKEISYIVESRENL